MRRSSGKSIGKPPNSSRAARSALRGLLRGDLHCHSDWSDGTTSIAEMAAAARALIGPGGEASGPSPVAQALQHRRGMAVHGRTGEACPVCGDVVREVTYADSSLQYCATCQTGGQVLADRSTSRFVK